MSCGDDSYSINGKDCINCVDVPDCQTCLNAGTCNNCASKFNLDENVEKLSCEKCASNYFYQDKKCVKQNSCENGKFFDITENSCKNCPSSCAKCDSASSCSECKNEFHLIGGLCQTCLQALNIANCISCEIKSNLAHCNECANGKKNDQIQDCTNENEKEEDQVLKKSNILIFYLDQPIVNVDKKHFSFHVYFFSIIYPSNYTFTLNINLIAETNKRILSSQNMKTTCTLNDITLTDQKIYVSESICEGEKDIDKQISSLTTSTSMNTGSSVVVSVNYKKTGERGMNISDYKNSKMLKIVVEKLKKDKGWTNDGYSFVLISKDPINNNVGVNNFTVSIENDKISAEAKCEIPLTTNIISINCVTFGLSSSGKFKMLDKDVYDSTDTFPKIYLSVLKDSELNIEKKQKLSRGGKIGIIVGICVFAVICIVLLIMYKTGVFCKKDDLSKNSDYTIESDKPRKITNEEIMDNKSKEDMIEEKKEKYSKQ